MTIIAPINRFYVHLDAGTGYRPTAFSTVPHIQLFWHNWLCTPAHISKYNLGRGKDVGKVHLCDRRCGVFVGEGLGGGLDRLLAREPRAEGQPDEVRSLFERGPRNDVSISARRSFRDRRRRRNRPRPWPLRALHPRQTVAR